MDVKTILDSISKGETIAVKAVSNTKEEIVTELLANFSGIAYVIQ